MNFFYQNLEAAVDYSITDSESHTFYRLSNQEWATFDLRWQIEMLVSSNLTNILIEYRERLKNDNGDILVTSDDLD